MSGNSRTRRIRGREGQLLPWRRRLRPFDALGHFLDVGSTFDVADVPAVGPILFLLLCPFVWLWRLSRSS